MHPNTVPFPQLQLQDAVKGRHLELTAYCFLVIRVIIVTADAVKATLIACLVTVNIKTLCLSLHCIRFQQGLFYEWFRHNTTT
jgi:hypothetical protein